MACSWKLKEYLDKLSAIKQYKFKAAKLDSMWSIQLALVNSF